MSHLQELDHLRIPFDDIKSATNNFSHQNFLGQGGFGRVYKGQLPSSTDSSEPGTTVAVKRLDVKLGGQGEHEFLTEILMLASYKHDNLVSLIGFSEDGNEKVLVYKYEVNGSLDKHLASTNLTWAQRLSICLGSAQGLDYLHEGVGAGHRVLHRDIKSSNVLLDANWEARISDFGLSKIGPTNQPFTFLVTNACGTFGYLDPQYQATGVLTKESDVYSFGVVLFEVLCGRLAMIVEYEDERRFLSRLVKLQHKGTLHHIILPNLLEQMKPYSLEVFSNIAFQCLHEDRKQRPPMNLVVKELETALKYQLDTRSTVSDPRIRTRTRLWGSVIGGWPFLFQLESNQKLRKITIGHDRWIHSLMFTVEDSDGLLHSSEQYGGLNDANNKGLELSTIPLEADEEIIGISGTVGRRYALELITTLSFETNKRTYGPFGQKDYIRPRKKAQFSSSWDLGSFHGFYGRCGWYVEALGCYLKTNI